ncbi:hypothetical protein Ae505Ps2_6208c [Pseudonocardia sp. Ae505_Ps2]|nr:hypothetical protein Ae331Ps2_6267c [Pseudonocardia sp. Ae331_Ps2]OLM08354.1 hypothetical protein Ae505Ps2_6208c [Pseudonocardia sp. Ae505_Ps2]
MDKTAGVSTCIIEPRDRRAAAIPSGPHNRRRPIAHLICVLRKERQEIGARSAMHHER